MQDKQKEFADVTLASAAGDAGDLSKIRASVRKSLKGHINKVTSCHYSGDSRSLPPPSPLLIVLLSKRLEFELRKKKLKITSAKKLVKIYYRKKGKNLIK